MLDNADKFDNEAIKETIKDLVKLTTIVGILCPAKKAPSPDKRVTRTAQPGEVAPIWSLTGQTRRPENIQQPVQKEMQPHKFVLHVEI